MVEQTNTTNTETEEEIKAPTQRPCATPNCSQIATMQCPTCIKMGLEPTYFCNQQCFTGFWKFHKMSHQKPEVKQESGIYTGPLRPFPYSFKGHRKVPDHIKKPDYARTAKPSQASDTTIPIMSDPDELVKLRKACIIARQALDAGHAMVKPGVTTEQIDEVVHNFIIEAGGYPSPLNYYKFPRSCCTSVNEIICHGIPDSRPLEEGDIVNLDVTAYFEGYHGDLNETYCVGKVSESSRKLIAAAYDSLMKAIDYCKPNSMYREVGNIISNHVEPLGYSVVRSYTGHGIGSIFHQAPNVPHYRQNKAVGFMKKGHVFTIEPMINAGTWKDFTWKDDWTSSTVDGQRSAQFEHTLIITAEGVEVLTARLPTSPPLEFMEAH